MPPVDVIVAGSRSDYGLVDEKLRLSWWVRVDAARRRGTGSAARARHGTCRARRALAGRPFGFGIGIIPLLGMVGGSFWPLLIAQCIGMVLLSGYTSIAAAVNAEVFPGRVRASGIGFPYSLTVALFGGTAPYVATQLTAWGHPEWFPIYVIVLCVIGFVVYVRLPETAHRPLD
jgi:MFS family permease